MIEVAKPPACPGCGSRLPGEHVRGGCGVEFVEVRARTERLRAEVRRLRALVSDHDGDALKPGDV